jgi:hypothetical protein
MVGSSPPGSNKPARTGLAASAHADSTQTPAPRSPFHSPSRTPQAAPSGLSLGIFNAAHHGPRQQ